MGLVNCAINIKELVTRAKVPTPGPVNEDLLFHEGAIMSMVQTASGLAAKSPLFQPLHEAVLYGQHRLSNEMMADIEPIAEKTTKLPDESRDRMNAALEYLRLAKVDLKDTGRRVIIKTKEITEPLPGGGERVLKPALSKPGDTISLTQAETDLLFEIKDYLSSRWEMIGLSYLAPFGYDGAWDRAEVEAWAGDQDKLKADILRLYDAVERQRVTGYVPFMRSGDVRVIVRGPDGKMETGAFYLLDSNQWARNIVGPKWGKKLVGDKKLAQQVAEIRKLYPASEGFKVEVTRIESDKGERLGLEDLGALDKLLNLMDARSGAITKQFFSETMAGMLSNTSAPEIRRHAEQIAKGFIKDLPANVKSILLKDVLSGIMKQSRNIAGYDTNLLDRLLDYNRMVASSVSHRLFRNRISAAHDNIMKRAEEPERNYATKWLDYVDTPEHAIWRGARAVGFFNAMWGSLASSMVNAMATWTVTAPQLAVMKQSAFAEIYKVSAGAIAAMRGNLTRGAFIDISKIPGLTADERAAVLRAYQRGVTAALLSNEYMGSEATLLPYQRTGLGKLMSTWLHVGASVVTVTEELSKISAFIVAYRMAKDPVALKNWQEAFANNQTAKAIMARGSKPAEVAEFMVDTTTFIGGQVEKPPVMRGVGGVMLQFSQWPLQLMKLLYRNFTKMGQRGQLAGTMTILMMLTVSGVLYGIPFGDDAINIFDWLREKISGEKHDFRNDSQRLLAEILGDRRAAEAIMYGPLRAFLGVNAGQRIGFSSFLPELGDPVTAVPALAGTIGKFSEYSDRMRSGQPVGAYTALLSPAMGKGTTDLMKATLQLPMEGYQTRFGRVVKSPEEIDGLDIFARAIGFQSADIARKLQANRAADEVKTGTMQAEINLKVRLAKKLAAAVKAEEAGDMARAQRLQAEFEAEIGAAADEFQKDVDAGRMAYAVRPPSSAALREAMIEQLYPEMAVGDASRLKRQEMMDIQNDLLGSDEEDLFYEPE